MLTIFLLGVGYCQAQAPAPGCPQITCVMFCKNGVKKDANGCDTCSCASVPGQGVASLDCSQAPGWGWCAHYSQCVNPAQTPCPGGITSTPGRSSGGALGVMPNPSAQSTTTTAAVGSHLSVDLPIDLPSQLAPSQVDAHGCPANYPWCASIQSCSAPEQCGNADVTRAFASGGFAAPPAPSFSGSFLGAVSFPATSVPATSLPITAAPKCTKKSCKSCRAQPGCNWHTTNQCLPYCRPDGTCVTLGQTCPASIKSKKTSSS